MTKLNFKIISLLALIILTFLSSNINAQEVFYGNEQKYNYREGKHGIVGRLGNRIITYRTVDHEYFLDLYDDSMNHKATVAIDFLPKKTTGIDFYPYKDKLIVLYRTDEKGKISLNAAQLDSKGMLIGKSQTIIEEKSSWFKNKRYQWSTITNENKSSIAIIGKGGSKDKAAIKMVLINYELDILKQDSFLVNKEKSDDEISLPHTLLSNDNSVIVPNYYTTSAGFIKRASVMIYDLSSTESKVKEYPFSNKKILINDFIVKVDNVRQLIRIAALYEDDNRASATGTMLYDIPYTRIDNTDSPRYQYHPEAFLKILSDKGWKKAMRFHKLKDIIVVNEGGVMLITESQRIEEKLNNTGAYLGYDPYYASGMDLSSSRAVEYFYGDICVMRYNSRDVLAWSEFVRKYQISQDDMGVFSSFAVINTGGTIVMPFNNFGVGSGTIGMGAIDKDGKLQLSNYSEIAGKSDWAISEAKQIGIREVIIPSFRRNNLIFNRIVF